MNYYPHDYDNYYNQNYNFQNEPQTKCQPMYQNGSQNKYQQMYQNGYQYEYRHSHQNDNQHEYQTVNQPVYQQEYQQTYQNGYPHTYQQGYQNIQNPRYRFNNMPTDLGPTPSTINIEKRTEDNPNYRTTLWTGNNLQLTLMSIPVGESIGLEVHPNIDQFIKLEEGHGLVELGPTKNDLSFKKEINSNYAVLIPAGTYHNITNIGNEPLKLYSIYAPVNHPKGTINITKP